MKLQRTSVLFLPMVLLAQAPNPTQSTQPVVTTPTVVFRTTVTARTVKAINYNHRQGSTSIGFAGTALMPNAKGEARVDSKTGATKVEVNFDKLLPAQIHGNEFLTYVLWAITPEGRAENLGEVMLEGDSAKLQASSELQAFGMIVTAEPYWAVTQPSDVVVMEGVVKQGSTTGTITPVDARYELLQRGAYSAMLPAADRAILQQKNDMPLDLKEARHAMAIARAAGAQTYAADTMQKADNDLRNAEAFWQSTKDKKRVQTLARNVAQLAEDARIVTVRKREAEQLAAERQQAEQSLTQAKADTEREARQRAEVESSRAQVQRQLAETRLSESKARDDLKAAEAERVLLVQQAMAARQAAEAAKVEALKEQQRLIEETARIRSETEAARAKAEEERQRFSAEAERARLAAAAAEDRSRQADAERLRMRDELRQQLNIVLQTRDSARGLIVNMSDVLFDTAQSTLRQGAREKLAKVAGIILAHPDLSLQIEGHTDSVGDESYNQKLSEKRAAAVSDFLLSQGVKPGAISSKGLGESAPVASNDNAAGRQQNRRVELVVTGESIKATGAASVAAAANR